MKLTLLLCLFMVVYASGCESLVINCKYDVDYSYQCIVLNNHVTFSKECREIVGIRGFHAIGKSHNDVKQISFIGKTVNYFPRGITKFFENIERVDIESGSLKEITKEDLREFGDKLKILRLPTGNEIEVIEADLFIYNNNLEWINLTNNKIKHIENGVFDHLENLRQLHLTDNPSTSSSDETYERSNLMTVIQSVEGKCKDQSYAFLETKNAEIEKLKEEIEQLQDEIRRLKKIE